MDAGREPNIAPAEPTDEDLIASTLAGDDEAFAALVRRHKRRIIFLAARFARNDHERDDIAQEAFVKAYQSLGQFRGDAPFAHWLARIGVRACYDFLRRVRRTRQTVPLDGVDLAVADNVAPAQAREVLDWALAQLPAKQRLVLTLLELEERSVREIAALTGWSDSNVKVRAHRARQALKSVLEKSHER